MSWIYVPELVASPSPASGSSETGEQSATSSLTPTVSESCSSESQTATSTTRPCGTTSKHSMGDPGVDRWISSRRASRASHSAPPGSEKAQPMSGTCGPTLGESFAKYDPATCSWKTSQVCLFDDTLAEYSETWPRAGTACGGTVYRRQPSAPITGGTGCGLSEWQTPQAADATFLHCKSNIQNIRMVRLSEQVRRKQMWPTPQARDGDQRGAQAKRFLNPERSNDLPDAVAFKTPRTTPRSAREYDGTTPLGGGGLNPTWVEWLMGFPLGWTDSAHLETASFQRWLQKHGRL
jgi:hypothetical protein